MIGLCRSAVALAHAPLSPVIAGALTHRYRSDRGVTLSSGNVTQWDDISGNGNHATQVTDASRPTVAANSHGTFPAIRFDGTNAFMDVPADGTAGARTYIIVAKTSRTAANRLFDHGSVGYLVLNSEPRALLLMGATNYRYFLDFSQADDGALHAFAAEIHGTSQTSINSGRVLADGAAQTASTTVTSGTTSSWSAMRLGGGTNRFQGDMFEVLVYNRVLTALELASVHTYLLTYYA